MREWHPDSSDPHSLASVRLRNGRRDGVWLGLAAFVVALTLTGALLWFVGGPPRPPARLPDLAAIRQVLVSTPGVEDFRGLTPWIFLVCWLLWLWLVASVVLQVGVALLEFVTRGAAWVRGLRRLVDGATATVARRVVTGATTTILVARLATATVQTAAAAPGAAPAPALVLSARDDPHAGHYAAYPHPDGVIEHVVDEGDTLWSIAARYYGDGNEYQRLIDANRDRYVFHNGVIHPGDIIYVPAANGALRPDWAGPPAPARADLLYTVKAGDTLRSIALEHLGDETLWPQIEVAGGGSVRTALPDPNLIHPGLQLVVKGGVGAGATAAPAAPAQVSPTAPSAVPVDPAPASPDQVGSAPAAPTPGGQPAPPPAARAGGEGAGAGVAAAGAAAQAQQGAGTTAPALSPGTIDPRGQTAGARESNQPQNPTGQAVPTPATAPSPAPVAPATAPDTGPGRVAGTRAIGIGGGAAALGGAALVAGAMLLRKRVVTRRLREAPAPAWQQDPENDPEDFAAAAPAPDFTHRVVGGETEPAVVIAGHAARFLAEAGLVEATILLAAHDRQSATLTVRAPAADQPLLVELAPRLGARLGGKGKAVMPRGAAGDVELQLTGPTASGVLKPFGDERHTPRLVPFAALPTGAPLYGNWDAFGHVLVAGQPGDGADTVLTSIVAELTARRPPETLQLWAIAGKRTLPSDLLALPHWGEAERIDPGDGEGVRELLDDLRRELQHRRREGGVPGGETAKSGAAPGAPRGADDEVVLVVGDLADLAELAAEDGAIGTALEQLGQDGPAVGLRILAATVRPEAIGDDLLTHFATRLVLRLPDEGQSVRFVGTPEAATLGGGGRLLPRLAGQLPQSFAGIAPQRLRGQRIAPEDLAALVQSIRSHYYGHAAAIVSDPSAWLSTPLPETAPPPAGEAEERAAVAGDEEEGGMACAAEAVAVLRPSGPLIAPADTTTGRPAATMVVTHGANGHANNGYASEEGGVEEENDGEDEGDAIADRPNRDRSTPSSDHTNGQANGHGHEYARGVDTGASLRVLPVRGTPVGTLDGPAGGATPDTPPTALESLTPSRTTRNGHSARLADLPLPGAVAVDDESVGEACLQALGIAVVADDEGADGEIDREADEEADRAGGRELAGETPAPTSRGELARVAPTPASEGELADATPTPASGDEAALVAPAPAPEGASVPLIATRAFGTFDVRRSDNGAPIVSKNRKQAWEILQFLAASPPEPQARNTILTGLWPEVETSVSRERFYVALHTLRDLLVEQIPELGGIKGAKEAVRADNGRLWLDPRWFDCDVHHFWRLCQRVPSLPLLEAVGACVEAQRLLAGPVLAGEDFRWKEVRADGLVLYKHYPDLLARVSEVLGKRCLEEGQTELALNILEGFLATDPTNEEIIRLIYACHGARGDRRGLIEADRTLRAALRRQYLDDNEEEEELDDSLWEPYPETQEAFNRIREELSARDRGRSERGPYSGS